jgi:hypothetical protein
MMRKINLLLLAAFITGSLSAGTHTQKTYIQTRPFLSNLPMEYSTWHTQVNKDKIGSWGGSFQATGFFQSSQNESNLGTYFGYNPIQDPNGTRDYIPVEVANDADDIPAINIFHNRVPDDNALSGKIQLNPAQRAIGLRLDYYQAFKDFFFKVSTPITHVESGLHPKAIGPMIAATEGAGSGQTIINYFEGNVEETTAGSDNLQNKLQYAKIGKNQSRTGLGDIELAAGYSIFKKKGHHFKAGIDLTIPTGNKAKGEWLMEPITGNGGYWGLGVFADSKFLLWKHEKGKIEFLTAANLQYLFSNNEKRTLGLKDYGGRNYFALAQYYLAGQQGTNALFPAANVLTQDVKVEPQLNFELMASTVLISDNFTFEFGYNLFYKEKETIKLRHDWTNNTYALAVTDYDSSGAAFNPETNSFDGAGPINWNNIDLEPAQTPSALTNKVYCAMGYSFNEWKRPWMLGMGLGYEFHAGNTALEGFEIWMKTALSF